MAKLVGLMGGKDTYVKRLETFFTEKFHDIGYVPAITVSPAATNHPCSDEPGFLPCFLYNYGGRPDLTIDRVMKVLDDNYFPGPAGLPGNDDSGAMGGFVVFASFGFFPVAGESVYLMSAPLFPKISWYDPEQNTTATVIVHDFDGIKKNRYIQRATLNGAEFNRNWFAHDEMFGIGGTMELWMGPTASKWGTREEDLPPSMSTGGRFMGMLSDNGGLPQSVFQLQHGGGGGKDGVRKVYPQ